MSFIAWIMNMVAVTIPQLINTFFKHFLDSKKKSEKQQRTNIVENPDHKKTDEEQKRGKRSVAPSKEEKRKNPFLMTDEDIDELSIDDPDYFDKMAMYLAGDRSPDKIHLEDRG